MTKQEIFDTVWDWFITQNQPYSVAKDELTGMTKCKYRGPNGEKCAAGIFITDDEYYPDMEGKVVNAIECLGSKFRDSIDFLRTLQRIHDTCAIDKAPVSLFASNLRQFAFLKGLEVPK